MIIHIGCATPQSISSNSNNQPTNRIQEHFQIHLV